MAIDFTGSFEGAIHKQRIVIPSDFRKQFEEDPYWVATLSPGKIKTILLYPAENWSKIRDKLKSGDARQRKILSYFQIFAMAPQQYEGPGRVKFTPKLLENAGIDDKAILMGETDFISIWSPEMFRQEEQKRIASIVSDDFESTDFQI